MPTNLFNNDVFSSIPIYNRENKEENIKNLILSMLCKSSEMFQYHNLPDSIPCDMLERYLQINGYCIIAEHEGQLYALQGGAGGECDAYYRPTQIIVTNPWLKLDKTFIIDKDCVFCKNDSYAVGLVPMISKYASMIIENEITIDLASINMRIIAFISASDNKTIESAEDYIKEIEKGKQSVIADEKLFESLKIVPTSGSKLSLQELYATNQYLKGQFYQEIGLSSNYNMKRERLTKGEVEANTGNLYPLVDNMLDTRRMFIDKVNKMFGTDIAVEFNSSWDIRLLAGEKIDANTLKGLNEDVETNETDEPTVVKMSEQEPDKTTEGDQEQMETLEGDQEQKDTTEGDQEQEDTTEDDQEQEDTTEDKKEQEDEKK